MLVEYGRLKMLLVTLQGLLTPFSMPIADFLPEWVRFVAGCAQGASLALFSYLLRPAAENPEDMVELLNSVQDQKEEDDEQPPAADQSQTPPKSKARRTRRSTGN